MTTREGYALSLTGRSSGPGRGAPHPLVLRDGLARKPASLRPADEILLNDHRRPPQSGRAFGDRYHEGFLIGLLIGDGTLKSDKAVLIRLAAAGRESSAASPVAGCHGRG